MLLLLDEQRSVAFAILKQQFEELEWDVLNLNLPLLCQSQGNVKRLVQQLHWQRKTFSKKLQMSSSFGGMGSINNVIRSDFGPTVVEVAETIAQQVIQMERGHPTQHQTQVCLCVDMLGLLRHMRLFS